MHRVAPGQQDVIDVASKSASSSITGFVQVVFLGGERGWGGVCRFLGANTQSLCLSSLRPVFYCPEHARRRWTRHQKKQPGALVPEARFWYGHNMAPNVSKLRQAADTFGKAADAAACWEENAAGRGWGHR